MSICSRCGLPNAGMDVPGDQPGTCWAHTGLQPDMIIECRDRQIAAQASLLRSVTGKLEEALEALEAQDQTESALRAYGLIDSVLEALS